MLSKHEKNMFVLKSGSINDGITSINSDRPSSFSTLKQVGISLTAHSNYDCEKNRSKSENNLSVIKTDKLDLTVKKNRITKRSRDESNRSEVYFQFYTASNTPAKCEYFCN